MEELHERDGAAISAGNSNFYGKNLLLDLIQGINKKEWGKLMVAAFSGSEYQFWMRA